MDENKENISENIEVLNIQILSLLLLCIIMEELVKLICISDLLVGRLR